MTSRRIADRIDATATKNSGYPAHAAPRNGASILDPLRIQNGTRAIEVVIAASSKLQRLRNRIDAIERALARVGAECRRTAT
jgi:hypothetical protein